MLKKIEETACYLKAKMPFMPKVGIVLGTGLGELAKEIKIEPEFSYTDIPNFPISTVEGHSGKLIIGYLGEVQVLAMQGRFHYYEGYSMQEVTFPIRIMKALGVETLLLSNAAGGMNPEFEIGELMIINDHIKLIQDNPLRGMNPDALGPRFFDMCTAYDPDLIEVAKAASNSTGVETREGVYMLFTGPSFETKAEVRFARISGADAVGMSTVPEAIAASHMRMHTLGISCLTNMAAGILDQPLNHEEVIETGNRVKAKFTKLVREIVKTWPKSKTE